MDITNNFHSNTKMHDLLKPLYNFDYVMINTYSI